jgi:hypothetical protein
MKAGGRCSGASFIHSSLVVTSFTGNDDLRPRLPLLVRAWKVSQAQMSILYGLERDRGKLKGQVEFASRIKGSTLHYQFNTLQAHLGHHVFFANRFRLSPKDGIHAWTTACTDNDGKLGRRL